MANGEAYKDEDFSFDVNHGFLTGFSDVDGHAYYAKAIAWAAKAGVVNGYADGTFRAEKNITSEEFAAMASPTSPSSRARTSPSRTPTPSWPPTRTAPPCCPRGQSPRSPGPSRDDVMGNGAKLDAASNISRARVAAMAVNYQPDGVEDLIKPSK